MSLEAVVTGQAAAIGLTLWAANTLSKSQDQWRNWAGALMFSGGLIQILMLFGVIYQIADNVPYAYLTDILVGAIVVASITVFLWAMLELLMVFWGAAKASYEVIKQFLNRIQEAKNNVKR